MHPGALFSAAVIFLGGSSASQLPPSDVPTFTVSTAATEPLVRISYYAGTLPLRVDYILYGDGRLERVITDAAYPTKREETTLSKERVRELVASAVSHGLAGTAQKQLDDKIVKGWAFDPKRQPGTPAIPPPPSDAGTAEVEIRLASLDGAKGPITNRLRLRGLEDTAKQLPAIAELQAWVQLRETFDALLRDHQQ